jgi:hypothetical protein
MWGISEVNPEVVHHANYWGFVQDARWHDTDIVIYASDLDNLRCLEIQWTTVWIAQTT